MANYNNKRRPLSCEAHLSVIQEEELESLRKRREWVDTGRSLRRSKSASDGDLVDVSDESDVVGRLDDIALGTSDLCVCDSVQSSPCGQEDMVAHYDHVEREWESLSLRSVDVDRLDYFPGGFRQLPFDSCSVEGQVVGQVDGVEDQVVASRKILLKTNSLDQIKPKGNKYIRRALPFLSRMTSNLMRAVPERDPLRVADFSLSWALPLRPGSSSVSSQPPTVRNKGTF